MAKPVDKDDEDKKPRAVLHRYQNRLKILRLAQDFSHKDQIATAVQYYIQYLEALASFHGVEEKSLGPEMFNKEKDLGELLLISHVYWDLAKAFDRNPKFQMETIRYLNQFVKFTIGFKYQYINSELIRKFIKKKMAYNPRAFDQAYDRIRIYSKKCYIASHCFGENHPKTNRLRRLKLQLIRFEIGREFVDWYYRFSPRLISYCEAHPRVSILIRLLFFPILSIVSSLIPTYEKRKCLF